MHSSKGAPFKYLLSSITICLGYVVGIQKYYHKNSNDTTTIKSIVIIKLNEVTSLINEPVYNFDNGWLIEKSIILIDIILMHSYTLKLNIHS